MLLSWRIASVNPPSSISLSFFSGQAQDLYTVRIRVLGSTFWGAGTHAQI